MKRLICLLLALTLCVLCFAGCANDEKEPANDPTVTEKQDPVVTDEPSDAEPDTEELDIPVQQLTIGTASAGGAFYPIGTGLAEVITQHVEPLYVTAEITGGSVENVILTGTGECDLAISNADHVADGIAGRGSYDTAYDVNAICSLHASILHIVTLGNTGVKSVEDLKGKKVAVGPAGGGSIPMITAVLEAYGMTFDDITPTYVSYDDGITQLKDGQVDAALVGAGYPSSSVLALQATDKVVMVSLTEEAMAKISENNPAYSKVVVPADTYGMDSDVIVLGVRNLVYCSPDLSEDTVYAITKALYENLTEVQSYHNALTSVTQETMVDVSGVPLHPGAERFYKEIGVLN